MPPLTNTPLKKPRAKADAPAHPVPQSATETNSMIRRIGELDRQIGLLDIGFKDASAKVKETFEAQSQPLAAERDGLVKGVQIWCDANRKELTDKGAVKYATFPAGKVLWRLRPARAALPRDVSGLLTFLKAHTYDRFIRVSEEVSKEALLAEPDLAQTFPGVKIGSTGEDFVIEPYTAEQLEGAA